MKGHATVGPEALYHDPELARFYDLANGWREDFDFCMRLAEGAASVLDLGCGTGQLAAALAEAGNREVFGADPATGIVTYWTHYEVVGTGRRFSADARLAFPDRSKVETLIEAAGLRVLSLFGDWDGSPWHEHAREIVVMGGQT